MTVHATDPAVRISTAEPRPELRAVADGTEATVVEVGSTGVHALEPLVVATRAGRSAFHVRCSPDRLADVVAAVESGANVGDAARPDAVVDHDPGRTDLPVPDLEGLTVGTRRLLGGAGWRRPTVPDDHATAGGFVDGDPETVEEIAGRLRGRGWGDRSHDAPLVECWETARTTPGEVAVVVNAHGSPADGLLLSSVPFEVLDGASAAASAVDAGRIVVYAAEDDPALDRVRAAAAAYPDPPVPIDVVGGPAAYRAAEPTMALEAVEGSDRLEARLRPPGPEAFGLDGAPTLVHTARTLAHLAVALREGAPAETRLVSVRGDVAAPATVELPESGVLETALDAVAVDGRFKAACVGGRFGGVASSLEIAPDPDALADAGLGTEGTVEVLAEGRCLVAFAGRRSRFAAETNCGRCVPCREGTTQLVALLREFYDGDDRTDEIEELVRVMDTSICAFGRDAGRPARTAMAEFAGEFAAHADGRCPAGSCTDPLEAAR